MRNRKLRKLDRYTAAAISQGTTQTSPSAVGLTFARVDRRQHQIVSWAVIVGELVLIGLLLWGMPA